MSSTDRTFVLLKIAGQEHADRHRPTEGIKQWMSPAVDTQLNQLFHTQFHQFSDHKWTCGGTKPLLYL